MASQTLVSDLRVACGDDGQQRATVWIQHLGSIQSRMTQLIQEEHRTLVDLARQMRQRLEGRFQRWSVSCPYSNYAITPLTEMNAGTTDPPSRSVSSATLRGN